MNALHKERMFRTEIAWKIAEIEDKQCAPCEYSGKTDRVRHFCRDCPVGEKLLNLGNLLNKKTKDYRQKNIRKILKRQKQGKLD